MLDFLFKPLIVIIFFLVLVVYLFHRFYKKSNKFIKKLDETIKNINEIDEISSSINLVSQINKIVKDNIYLEKAYKHFEMSQFRDNENGKTYATHKIEEYITFDYVYKLDRVTEDAGGILTGFGLLITFGAITYGLYGLNISNSIQLQEGISHLIGALSAKFVGSICGILFALIFMGLRNWIFNKIDEKITELNTIINDKIDNKYSENILIDISSAISSQTNDLKEFFSGSAFHDALLKAMNNNENENKVTRILNEIKIEISKQNGSELINNIQTLINNLQGSVSEISSKQSTAINESLNSFKQETERSLTAIQEGLVATTQQLKESLEESSRERLNIVEDEQRIMLNGAVETLNKFMNQLTQHNSSLQSGLQVQQSEMIEANKLVQEQLKENQQEILNGFVNGAKSFLGEIINVLSKQQELHSKIENMLNLYNQAIQTNENLLHSNSAVLDKFNASAENINEISKNLSGVAEPVKHLANELILTNNNVKQQIDTLNNKEIIVKDGLDRLTNSFAVQMGSWQNHIDQTEKANDSTNLLISKLHDSIENYTTQNTEQVQNFLKDFTTNLSNIITHVTAAVNELKYYSENLESISNSLGSKNIT